MGRGRVEKTEKGQVICMLSPLEFRQRAERPKCSCIYLPIYNIYIIDKKKISPKRSNKLSFNNLLEAGER